MVVIYPRYTRLLLPSAKLAFAIPVTELHHYLDSANLHCSVREKLMKMMMSEDVDNDCV